MHARRISTSLRIRLAIYLLIALVTASVSFSPAAAAQVTAAQVMAKQGTHQPGVLDRFVHSGSALRRAGRQERAPSHRAMSFVGRPAASSMDASAAAASTPAFAGFKTSKSIPLPDGSYSVLAVADLNGDGKPDVLTVDHQATGSRLQAYLNDGKGGYTPAAPGAVIPPSLSISYSSSVVDSYECVMVDVTANGKPSLACIQESQTGFWLFSLALYPSNGDGTFGPPAISALPAEIEMNISYSSWKLLVADFNGDGKQDVTAWQTQSPITRVWPPAEVSVQVFLSDGQGGLQTAKSTFLQATQPNGPTYYFGYDVLAGDLNGDGKADLLLNYQELDPITNQDTAGGVETLLGAGDGTFASGVLSPIVPYAGLYSMALLDYSGSGHPGLVYRAYAGLQAVPGNGDGTFGAPTAGVSFPSNLNNDAYGLQTAKMTNSGRTDLIIVSADSVGILRNTGSGSLGTPVFYPVAGQELVAAADWDGDGNTDILTFDGIDAGLTLLRGQGDGTFLGATGLYPPAIEPQTYTLYQPWISSMIPLDVNGDGRTDFVFSQLTSTYADTGTFTYLTTFSSYLDDAKGGYTFTPNILTIPSAYSLVDVVGKADFNGDGKADLLLEVYTHSTNGQSGPSATDELVGIALNNGDGSFTFPQNLVAGTTYDHNAIADVNGDGKPDVLLSTGTGLAIYLGDGTGKLVTPFTTLALPVGQTWDAVQLAVGDLNGDGKPDLVVSFDSTVEWFPANGDGTFGTPNPIAAGSGSQNSPMALGDWNGDGAIDIAIGLLDLTSAAPSIAILTNDGKGNFTEIGKIADMNLNSFGGNGGNNNLWPWDVNNTQLPQDGNIQVADLNGDGYPDLVATGNSYDVWVALGNGDGTFAPSLPIAAGTSSNRVMLGTVQGVANSIATYDGQYGEYLTLLLNKASLAASLSTSLSASPISVTTGAAVTLTATVASTAAGSPAPTGTVSFLEGTTVLGSVELAGGTASYQLSSLTAGSHTYTAQYTGDTNYTATPITGVTVTVTAPLTSLLASATSVTTSDGITLTATVAAALAGEPAPTGTVNFLETTPTATSVLGSANLIGKTAIYALSGLTAGSHVYTAQYSGDTNYATTAIPGVTVTVTVPVSTPLTPTVTVTPSAATITNQESATVTVAASGSTGAAVPTGSITLASGSSYIVVQSLSSGSTSFTIAVGTLATGSNTLTATYAGDGVYAASSGTTTVTVSPVAIVVPPPPAVAAGASTTATATISAGSTYSGTINLTCSLTASPAGAVKAPTCSLSPTSLAIATGASGTTVLTVNTTASTTSALAQPSGMKLPWLGGGATLAVLLMFGIPSRRRRWMSMLAVVAMLVVVGATGCGGGSSKSTTPVVVPGTTSGAYTFTIAGTDSTNSKIATSTIATVTVQ